MSRTVSLIICGAWGDAWSSGIDGLSEAGVSGRVITKVRLLLIDWHLEVCSHA